MAEQQGGAGSNEQDKKVCDLAPFRAFCVDSMRDWRHIN